MVAELKVAGMDGRRRSFTCHGWGNLCGPCSHASTEVLEAVEPRDDTAIEKRQPPRTPQIKTTRVCLHVVPKTGEDCLDAAACYK
jgi:hypothetical protein